jgi:hypothetical protein
MASLGSVEGRHSAYVNLLIGTCPFPNSFDQPIDPQSCLNQFQPFMTSCPFTLQIPVAATVTCPGKLPNRTYFALTSNTVFSASACSHACCTNSYLYQYRTRLCLDGRHLFPKWSRSLWMCRWTSSVRMQGSRHNDDIVITLCFVSLLPTIA